MASQVYSGSERARSVGEMLQLQPSFAILNLQLVIFSLQTLRRTIEHKPETTALQTFLNGKSIDVRYGGSYHLNASPYTRPSSVGTIVG